jgi:hypothetical protein
MRKLGLMDAFSFARLIKAADIRQEIAGFAAEISARKQANTTLNADDIGIEFVLTLITNSSTVEVESKIYELYASIKECSVEDVKTTDFETLKNDLKEIIAMNDLKAFFHSVSALMSKSQG